MNHGIQLQGMVLS